MDMLNVFLYFSNIHVSMYPKYSLNKKQALTATQHTKTLINMRRLSAICLGGVCMEHTQMC